MRFSRLVAVIAIASLAACKDSTSPDVGIVSDNAVSLATASITDYSSSWNPAPLSLGSTEIDTAFLTFKNQNYFGTSASNLSATKILRGSEAASLQTVGSTYQLSTDKEHGVDLVVLSDWQPVNPETQNSVFGWSTTDFIFFVFKYKYDNEEYSLVSRQTVVQTKKSGNVSARLSFPPEADITYVVGVYQRFRLGCANEGSLALASKNGLIITSTGQSYTAYSVTSPIRSSSFSCAVYSNEEAARLARAGLSNRR